MVSKPFFASTKVPLIESILSGLMKLPSRYDVLKKIELVKSSFITPKEQPEGGENLYLWMKGYGVDEGNNSAGYLGNFAILYPKDEGEYFTVGVEMVAKEPKFHPQRLRKPQAHPNWGHPLLRNIQKGKVYDNIDEPRKMLEKLHEEFPKITIPLTKKTYVMIYDGKLPPESRVQKWVLEIKVLHEGGFKIECVKNKFDPLTRTKPKKKIVKNEEDKSITEKKNQGFFTSLMALKKKPK